MRETKYEKFCLLGFVMVMYIILSFTKVKASNNIVIAGIDMGYSDGSYFIAILLINANSRCVKPPFAIIRAYCF